MQARWIFPFVGQHLDTDAVVFDQGAERLHSALRSGCDPDSSFGEQLQRSLRTVLDFLAAEPDFARLLILERTLNPGLSERSRRWQQNFAALLHDASACRPGLIRHPFYLEPFLISSLVAKLCRDFTKTEGRWSSETLPEMLEFLSLYYLDRA